MVVTGEVTSVDAKAGTFTVKAKDKEINLVADSKTTKAALEKLKVGDMVAEFPTPRRIGKDDRQLGQGGIQEQGCEA